MGPKRPRAVETILRSRDYRIRIACQKCSRDLRDLQVAGPVEEYRLLQHLQTKLNFGRTCSEQLSTSLKPPRDFGAIDIPHLSRLIRST